ncbi:MAG TPA: TrkA C-terminal domain-containing protein, partial [Candidatus Thermoplasmatota archaeon]
MAHSATTHESGEIEYEPRPVKDLLIEMKDLAELIVDLAYSAVIFDSEELGKEVLALEERMYRLRYLLRIQVMMSTRSIQDAQSMLGVLQVATASGAIANAAGDIVKVLESDLEYRPLTPFILRASGERIRLVTVGGASELVGHTLGELQLETRVGTRIIAIRRGRRWLYAVDSTTRVKPDDHLIVTGTNEGIDPLVEVAAGRQRLDEALAASEAASVAAATARPPVQVTPKGEPEAWLIEIKDTSDLMVDLAYSAILYESREIAEEVAALEEEVDDLVARLQRKVLEEAIETKNVDKALLLYRLASAMEQIADGAREISDAAMRNMEVHPILWESVRESDVTVARLEVAGTSALTAGTLGRLRLATKTGMRVIAIRRGRKWVVGPGPEDQLEPGDIVFARGPPAAEE